MQILESIVQFSIWEVHTPWFSTSAEWGRCISMLNSFPEHPEKALHGKIERSFPTCATEWETRCFSGTMAAPVTCGVSFEEKMITSLVVLEDIRCKSVYHLTLHVLPKFPVLPQPHLLLPVEPYSSSLHSDPMSGRFLTECQHGKSPVWVRDACKCCSPKEL